MRLSEVVVSQRRAGVSKPQPRLGATAVDPVDLRTFAAWSGSDLPDAGSAGSDGSEDAWRIVDHLLVEGVSTDSRTTARGDVFFALSGPRHDGHLHLDAAFDRGAVAAVVAGERIAALRDRNPGRVLLAADSPLDALGSLARAWRRESGARVVAVTGSCGKTTTKDMIATALRAAGKRCVAAPRSFNNNVGLPLTLLSLASDDEVAVVELGTSAPGEIAALAAIARPDVAVLTCIGESHLQHLGSAEGVLAEKMSIVDHLRPDGLRTVVVNGDDPRLAGAASRLAVRAGGPRVTTVGRASDDPRDDDHDVRARVDSAGWDGVSFQILPDGARVRLSCPGGRHLVSNALLAVGALGALGIDTEVAAAGLAGFEPPEGRFRLHRAGGVVLVDDTYNANPTSVRAALEAVSELAGRRLVLVLGDMRELGACSAERHREVGRAAAALQPLRLVAVGPLAREIASGARDAGLPIDRIEVADDPLDAADAIVDDLRSGDVVLFKASRVVALERAVARVERLLERRPVPRPAPRRATPGFGAAVMTLSMLRTHRPTQDDDPDEPDDTTEREPSGRATAFQTAEG